MRLRWTLKHFSISTLQQKIFIQKLFAKKPQPCPTIVNFERHENCCNIVCSILILYSIFMNILLQFEKKIIFKFFYTVIWSPTFLYSAEISNSGANIYFIVKQFKFSLPKNSVLCWATCEKYVNHISRGRDNGTTGSTYIHFQRYAARIGRLKNHRAIWLTAFANENFIKPEVSSRRAFFSRAKLPAARCYCKINRRAWRFIHVVAGRVNIWVQRVPH